MSNLAGWKLAVAAVVVGGGLYAVLEVLRPYHHPEVKLEGLVPADTVFGDAVAPAANTPSPSAAPAAAPPATTPAPAVATAEPVKAAPPAAADPKPTPAPAAKAPEPAPVIEKAETKPVVAAAAPAKPAVVKPTARPAAPTSTSKAPAISPVAWWQGSGSSSGLTVSYVGSAAFKRAVVVMTNGNFDNPAVPNRSIKVLSAGGKPVPGNWEVNATNPGMLIFPVSSNGVYQLVIGADLSDRQNRQLGRTAQGPIEIR